MYLLSADGTCSCGTKHGRLTQDEIIPYCDL